MLGNQRARFAVLNFLQPDLGSIELVDYAFMHGIHEGTDACGFGGTLLPDFDPDICTRGTKACIVVDFINALMQPFASLH
jgi:hypothetical protein